MRVASEVVGVGTGDPGLLRAGRSRAGRRPLRRSSRRSAQASRGSRSRAHESRGRERCREPEDEDRPSERRRQRGDHDDERRHEHHHVPRLAEVRREAAPGHRGTDTRPGPRRRASIGVCLERQREPGEHGDEGCVHKGRQGCPGEPARAERDAEVERHREGRRPEAAQPPEVGARRSRADGTTTSRGGGWRGSTGARREEQCGSGDPDVWPQARGRRRVSQRSAGRITATVCTDSQIARPMTSPIRAEVGSASGCGRAGG